jgi:ADP-ribosylglycohydrolase
MHQLLPMIRSGKRWELEARSLFGGQGSWANGSAMRVATLGAYFADDLDAAVEQPGKSAIVTHAPRSGRRSHRHCGGSRPRKPGA